MQRMLLRWIVPALVLATACSSDGTESVGSRADALIPPGSNAEFVSSTIPLQMFPGERLNVSLTMRNTGTGGAANTWTMSSPQYAFFRTGATTFAVNYDTLESTTTTGSTTTFNFILTAPTTPGLYTFTGRMGAIGTGERFGETVNIANIDVTNAAPRRWGCALVAGSSSIPSTVAPSESRIFTVTVQNTGTETWTPSNFFLYSKDSPVGFWNNVNRVVSAPVPAGGTATFSVPITAPAAPGAYTFRRQMFTSAFGMGFIATENCVDVPITVGGTPELNSAFVSNTLPATLAPGEVRSVSVTVENTGTASWPGDNSVFLYTANSPLNLYTTFIDLMTASAAPGDTHTFVFNITAPASAGMYQQQWRMRSSAGYFGPTLTVPLLVDGAATPSLNAAVSAQTVPSLVTAGEVTTFSITMQNTGADAWSGSNFLLWSTNSPLTVWGTNGQALGAAETVASGATRTFNLSVTAPATPGTYASRWRMLRASGAGFFGAEAVTSPVQVTLCGNDTLDAGEQCDDDNLMDGDGCSSTCQVEVVEFDLASTAVDRTLAGSTTNRQLSTVALGDVTGDSVTDVLVADAVDVVPTVGARRSAAGTVYGFTDGPSFFTNGSSTLPTGAGFRVFGASANDRLGTGTSADIATGDVTGDGVADLVVSSGFADGAMDARTDAGEVYVLAGGAGLTGDIDLGADPSPTVLVVRIIGAAAGDFLNVLAVGDVTGDSAADLVLGSPLADTANGVESGAVYIVEGGASLTGTVDLASPGSVVVHTILGATAGSRLGRVATIGDFTGSASNDLLLGNPNYVSGALSRAGAVWGFQGPIASDASTSASVGSASGPDFAWLGATQNDNLGSAVAIGNVLGDGANDVVIGAYQQRRGATQVGAVNVWDGGVLTLGTTYDLASASSQTAVFLGADAQDNAGVALELADMNGDGYLDIPVVSGLADGPGNARNGAGELDLFFGNATLGGTYDLSVTPGRLRIIGAGTTEYLGLHPADIAMADIDGDGLADLCVGSFQGGAARGGRIDCVQSPF